MDITIRVQPEEFITKELQWYVKAKLPEIVNEYFFQNPAELNKVIRKVLEGQLKATCVEVFQGKELREVLTRMILEYLVEENQFKCRGKNPVELILKEAIE